MNTEFTPFEKDVLAWLLAGDDPVLTALREQLAAADIESREYTGVGFYLNFTFPPDQKKLGTYLSVARDFQFGDLDIVFDSINLNACAILFVRDGLMVFLECVVFGDEWPADDVGYRFRYYEDKRDLEELRKSWTLPDK